MMGGFKHLPDDLIYITKFLHMWYKSKLPPAAKLKGL